MIYLIGTGSLTGEHLELLTLIAWADNSHKVKQSLFIYMYLILGSSYNHITFTEMSWWWELELPAGGEWLSLPAAVVL